MELDKDAKPPMSPDPTKAEEEVHKIDTQVASSTNAEERAGFLLNKANLLWLLGRTDEAKETLRLALEEAPNDPGTRFAFDHIRGSFLHREGRLSEAYDVLTAALSRHAELLKLSASRFVYEDIQRYRAFELFAMGDCTNAVPLLQEALSFESTERDRSVALAYLGNCSARMKNYELGRKYLLQALERGDLYDWEGQAHYDLAVTYASLKLLEQSKKELELCAERAVEFHLSPEKIYGWLSRICRGLGETSESERYARLARLC